MKRLPHYKVNLLKLINEYEHTPFSYGEWDCAIFAGKIVEAVTGDDLYSQFVGKYKTRIGGLRAFRKATGYQSHIDSIKSKYDEVPLSQARLGDIGIIVTDEGPAVVLIAGAFAIALTENGLGRVSIDKVKTVYRVGD